MLPTDEPLPTARAALAAFVLLVAVYGTFIALASPAAFPDRMTMDAALPVLSDKPVGEDGFYMLTVAWYLAEGRGLVYNFDLPTTGIQPLSTVIYGGAAWLVQQLGGDRWTLLRVVQLLGVLNLLLLGLVVGDIARSALRNAFAKRAAFVVAVAFTVGNFWLYRAVTYGLETGLYLLLLAMCVAYSIRALPRMDVRKALVLGSLAGLTGLARIDFGVVLFFFLGLAVLTRSLRLRHALAVGATAFVFVLPWFAWVHRVTGSWFPSSGGAQSSLVSGLSWQPRLREMGEALVNHLTPWMYTGSRGVLVLAGLVTLAVFIALFAFRNVPRKRSLRGLWPRPILLWAGALTLLCVVYYAFFGVAHFYERYTSPVLIVMIPMLAVFVAQRVPGRWQQGVALVPLLMLVSFGGWAALSLHAGRVGNTHAVTAGFVHERFPAPRVVGAFQSGAIGYFNPNVVNLDGKLNQRALDARRQGRMDAYVDSVGISVLVDWPGHIMRTLPQPYLERWALCDTRPDNDKTICIIRPDIP